MGIRINRQNKKNLVLIFVITFAGLLVFGLLGYIDLSKPYLWILFSVYIVSGWVYVLIKGRSLD